MVSTVQPDFVSDIVTRWAGMVNRKEVEGLLSACTADVEFLDAAFPEPFIGQPAVRSLLDTVFTAFPDLSYQPLGTPLVSLNEPLAAIRVRFQGTMTGPLDPPGFAPTCGRVDFTAVELFEFADERISRIELVFNVMALGMQIGAVPAPHSPGDRLGVRLQRIQAWRRRRRQHD